MLFTVDWIIKYFPVYQGEAQTNLPIEHIMTDSREEKMNSLFIPIVGERFNGHDYLEDAFAQGAVAVLWDKKYQLPSFLPAEFPVIFVNDTTTALQKLARYYREEINPTVIGITGSNGKTTTKDFMASVMKTTYRTHHTQGNLNNHIGLPLTILNMPRDTEILVLEMGMSDFGEIDCLTKIAQPDYAIITNIGESHIEHLGSRQGIAKAKLEIRNGLNENGSLIIDGDEPLLKSLHSEEHIITCGYNLSNDIRISDVKMFKSETSFKLNQLGDYSIPLLGKHHAKNATFAITVGNKLKIEHSKINEGLQNIHLSGMRFELSKGKNDVSLINDAYNASPTSMKAAIEVVKQMDGFQEKVLILGDMLELGHESKKWHESVAQNITDPITFVLTYGKEAAIISEVVNEKQPNIKSLHCETKKQLIKKLNKHLHKDALLLFKASRGMAFEQFVNAIS